LGSELSKNTVFGSHVEDGEGVVYLTKTREHALGYGGSIVVVDTNCARYFQDCPATDEPEFVVSVSDLEKEGAWWLE
jgi:hypothetical protein